MTYRRVDVSRFEPKPLTDQPKPDLCWVNVADLVIDEAYQRPLEAGNWKMIFKIAAEFHWSRFSPILCAPVGAGKMAVIDGQHRVHAAALRGIVAVPAMVIEVSAAEQSRAFAETNSNTIRITTHQLYRAALSAGEPWAVGAKRAVEDAGCRLMTRNGTASQKKAGEIYGVITARRAVEVGKAALYTKVLSAIRAYDTTNRVTLYSDFVIKPLFMALSGKPEHQGVDLVAFLRANDPYRVLDKARRARESGTGGSAQKAFDEALQAFRKVGGK